MLKTFVSFDDWLIERVFQPLCAFISGACSLRRVQAACLCLDVASLAWILSRMDGLSQAVTEWDPTHALFSMAVLLTGLVALTALRTLFRRHNRLGANPLRLAMRPHRGVLLLMLATRLVQMQGFGRAEIADGAMLLAAALALYLGACVEPPPVRRYGSLVA